MTPISVGETQLQTLLASMQPELHPTVFVFCTLDSSRRTAIASASLTPVCQFEEAEGLTLILSQGQAEAANLEYQYPCRLITLTIHSSLAAVGLLAAVSQTLAHAQISVNVVSACFHDHLFVPSDRADEALDLLRQLATSAKTEPA